ncbi:cytochrome P450 [Trichoderma evansii]
MSAPRLAVAAALAGVATHLLYFNRGEHHRHALRYILVVAASFVAVSLFTWSPIFIDAPGIDWESAIRLSAKVHGCFFLGLYSSLVTYRLFFHPLNKFPGPICARISTAWLIYDFRGLDGWKRIAALHEKYGPYVRIGPSELSVRDPKAVNAFHGPNSKCRKEAHYDFALPMTSLHIFRDKAQHDRRRRVWSQAFGDQALKGYEQRMQKYRDTLFDKIAASDGQPMNITKWFNFYSFDVMGDLAFGRSFDMLESSKNRRVIDMLQAGFVYLALHLPVWLLVVGMKTPIVSKGWHDFVDFCRDRYQARMKQEPDVPDIMSTLLKPLGGREPTTEEADLLTGDSQLVITAGSHTTSATMTSITRLLAKHPQHIAKIRQELAPFVHDSQIIATQDEMARLEHLNAVINESFRLYPPVPTQIYRQTPSEGITIDDVYIPGSMSVIAPQYAIGRNEAIYTDANSFIPERWYQFPDMIKNKDAFAPFSTGPYGCIGKRMALMDMRQVIARLVWTFDFDFAPGEDSVAYEKNAVDAFILAFGDVNMTFRRREV